MQDLYTYISEGILGDIDKTLNANDDFVNAAHEEFDSMVSKLSNHNTWVKKKFSTYRGDRISYRLMFNIKNISNLFGFAPNNILLIAVIKNNEHDNWELCIMLHNDRTAVKDYKSIRKEISQLNAKSFPAFLKNYILPYFKDLNTFAQAFK